MVSLRYLLSFVGWALAFGSGLAAPRRLTAPLVLPKPWYTRMEILIGA